MESILSGRKKKGPTNREKRSIRKTHDVRYISLGGGAKIPACKTCGKQGWDQLMQPCEK